MGELLNDRLIRVLLVDDHLLILHALSSFLSVHSDIRVAGIAESGKKGVQLAKKIKPDVILMDIDMPRMDGLEATKMIHSEFPRIRIIGLSIHDGDGKAAAMLEAGASAYCRKGGDNDILLSAIRGKAEGPKP
ncbi:MAG: DNA-binding response regulator [Desulfobacteraceae bacterium]|nr:MAG: DNA-binding response regulator [Desulfobacteraceae bacterium]